MFDRYALDLLKSPVTAIARLLHQRGVSPNAVSFAGFLVGAAAAALIVFGHTAAAIPLILISRALDGIDGALARLSAATDRGAFLDIALDFIFYALIPLAFALADPPANALAGAILLAAFVGTGSSFLAYAVVAEKRGLKSTAYPSKSIYYLGGLTEGTETIACFIAMCLWPQHFSAIALGYAALCAVTTVTRMVAGWKTFGP